MLDSRLLGKAGGNRHLFDDVPKLRVVVFLNSPRPGRVQQQAIALKNGHEPHHKPQEQGQKRTNRGGGQNSFGRRLRP